VTSSFFGLDMALRALQAQQTGIDVTSHNVANANTDGFSRQNVNIVTTAPYADPAMNRPATAGQLGTGAIAKNIERARGGFLDGQWRTESSSLANATNRQSALEQVEVVLDEPQGVGLNDLMNKYYKAWNDLTNDPGADAQSVRTTVVQQALSLTQAFNRIANQLVGIRTDLDGQVQDDVNEVNDITDQIYQLNTSIAKVELGGQTANDFRDRRDLLLDNLSKLVGVTTSENPDGSIVVSMGGQTLVNGVTGKTNLVAVPNAGNSNYVDVKYGTAAGPAAAIGTAGIAGHLTARDTLLPKYQAQLDTIAANLISATNTIHQTGFDASGNPGGAFFTGSNAATINVSAAIQGNAQLIAASNTAGAQGNNETALAIAKLQTQMSPPLPPGTVTSDAAYNSLVAGLGTDSRSAQNQMDTQQSLVDLLQRRREATSGVSLDEEATNMVRYQRAYEAAARVMTTYDEMLDKLINSTGVVGR
jgi:flagellar hook-associated protein 1 FlgK